MFNNSTNINKTNNHLSPEITEHKKRPQHMMLEIQFVARGVKEVNGILTLPLFIIGSPTATQIYTNVVSVVLKNKQ